MLSLNTIFIPALEDRHKRGVESINNKKLFLSRTRIRGYVKLQVLVPPLAAPGCVRGVD